MKRSFLLIILFAIGLHSCGRKSIVREYYVIEFPVKIDSTTVNQPPLYNGFCEILPIQIAPAYAGTQIAVRTESHQLNYYVQNEWAVRPEESINALLESYLQSRRLFSNITSSPFRIYPNFELYSHVYHLEAVEDRNRLKAHLHIDWELYERNANHLAVFHSFDISRYLARRNINQLAITISNILEEELRKFADKIENYLQQTQKVSPPATGGK